MKRLNFEQATAEKSSMSRIDPFFVLIVFLLSGLFMTFNASQYGLGDAQLQAAENRYLKKKVKVLELKMKEFEFKASSVPNRAQGRDVASVKEKSLETNPEKIAESLYQEVVEQCVQRKKNLICLDKVDTVLTQFPESKWAGKTLVLLTGRYIKEKRYEQASDLVQIIRGEFKAEPEVQAQLKQVEKSQL